jgi:hypothetical protein
MTRPSARRWAVLLALLAAAAWLAVFGDKTPIGVVSARGMAPPEVAGSAPKTSAIRNAAPGATEQIELLAARDAWVAQPSQPQADLFARAGWYAQEPVAVAAAVTGPQAPVPVPPPTYTVAGKQQSGEQWEVFLMRDDMSFVVRQGQVLEGTWRVERIEPPHMTVTHVPTGQEHQIVIGEAL